MLLGRLKTETVLEVVHRKAFIEYEFPPWSIRLSSFWAIISTWNLEISTVIESIALGVAEADARI